MGRVYVNGRFLVQPMTGIQRYAYNVCRRLPGVRYVAPAEPGLVYEDIPRSLVTVAPSRLPAVLWEQMVLPRRLSGRDVLWSPGGAGPVHRAKHVLTIHDVGLLDHPEWWPRCYRTAYRLLWQRAVAHAAHVVTVSHYCRERISEAFDLPLGSISVAPGAVDPFFRRLAPEETDHLLHAVGVPDDYVLAVSAVSARKNFSRLMDAWRLVCARFAGVSLVLVGDSGLRGSTGGTLGPLPPRTLYLGRVEDAVLRALYNRALLFAYPSLYEGFGLPPLEAMACGTAVLASNATSLPEVTGNAAFLVDPTSVDSIADGIARLIEDDGLRRTLIHNGEARVRCYSFDKTAGLVRTLLQTLAGSRDIPQLP